MANSTLNITNSHSAEQETPRPVQDLPSISLDELIEHSLEGFGLAKWLQAILVSLPLIFDGQQTFISVFTDAEPKWHCTNNTICNSSSNICNLSKSAWAWDSSSDKTIISFWELECASSFITGLPTSSYFIGCLFGGFFVATLADSWLGRKNLLFLSCLTMSIAALITAFSTNVWIYSALRFVSGFGRSSIVTCALVLLMEMVGKRWRGKVGMLGSSCFSLGVLSLTAIAYINRGSSWKTLYLWTSTPGILYCIIVYFFVNESPRWLIMRGREAEAIAILKVIASKDDSGLNSFLSNMLQRQETSKVNPYSSIRRLFTRRWAIRRILAAMALGLGTGMMFFGMLLGVGNLGFNIYLGVTFNTLMAVPTTLLTFFFIDKWNRKSSLLGCCIVSGVCGIICATAARGLKVLQIVLDLAALFGAGLAYNVIMIYSVELFPTCVRNSATSMVRQAVVLGSAIDPILISAGRKEEFLSYGVFGLAILCSAMFVMCLPETRGTTLCATMEEQERKDGTEQ